MSAQVCGQEKTSAWRRVRQAPPWLTQVFKKLLLPRKALNEEKQSQGWPKAVWIYFFSTIQVTLSCAKGISHACQQLVLTALLLHLKRMQQQIFSSNLFFLPVKLVHVSFSKSRRRWQSVGGVLDGSSGAIKSYRIESFGHFYTELPQDLFHLQMCSLSLYLWIILRVREYSGWQQMNLQAALQNAMQKTMGWTIVQPELFSPPNPLMAFDCHCVFACCFFFLLEEIWFVNQIIFIVKW